METKVSNFSGRHGFASVFSAAFLAAVFSGCAANLQLPNGGAGGATFTTFQQQLNLNQAQVKFNSTDFSSLTNPDSINNNCAGNAMHYYDPIVGSVYPASPADSSQTQRPLYIKDVTVDITNSDGSASSNLAQQCSLSTGGSTTAASQCAGFTSGYAAGDFPMYTTLDPLCAGQGPVSSPDPSVSKTLAGGVYIDIDRTQLGPNENLLLNITFFPLGTSNVYPAATIDPSTGITPPAVPLTFAGCAAPPCNVTQSQVAFFKIHLKSTGEGEAWLQMLAQPRFLTFWPEPSLYPDLADTISILAPPVGFPQQQQVLLPIGTNSAIDQIRIERVSGSAILVDASIYRLGYR